jgi:hypothetical protein
MDRTADEWDFASFPIHSETKRSSPSDCTITVIPYVLRIILYYSVEFSLDIKHRDFEIEEVDVFVNNK